MYTNLNLEIIHENQPYIGLDGTKYPRNFPKDEITELSKVTETPQPTGDIIIEGFIIDENYTQVWQTRDKTPEEIASDATAVLSAARQHALSAVWPDAFDLLDDILANGINDVKTRRNAIKAANPKP